MTGLPVNGLIVKTSRKLTVGTRNWIVLESDSVQAVVSSINPEPPK